MKTMNILLRTAVLSVVLLSTLTGNLFSQGTDSRQRYAKEGRIYAGIIITPQSTNISNNNFSGSTAVSQKGGMAVGMIAEGGFFFSKMFGIAVGAGMGSYSTELSLDSCSIKYTTTDTENESYEMRIKGKSITEDQKISLINIPVCIIMKYPLKRKLGLYAKAGLSINLPMKKTYTGKGTFTYDGYYAAYPVLLHDIPVYFPSNVSTSSSGDLSVKSLSENIIAAAGVSYQITESIEALVGLHFNKSLGSISAYSPSSNFMLSSKPDELKSIMEGSKDAGVQGLGISIAVKYFIK